MELFRNDIHKMNSIYFNLWVGAIQLQDIGGLLARGYSSQGLNNLQSEILVVHSHVPWGKWKWWSDALRQITLGDQNP